MSVGKNGQAKGNALVGTAASAAQIGASPRPRCRRPVQAWELLQRQLAAASRALLVSRSSGWDLQSGGACKVVKEPLVQGLPQLLLYLCEPSPLQPQSPLPTACPPTCAALGGTLRLPVAPSLGQVLRKQDDQAGRRFRVGSGGSSNGRVYTGSRINGSDGDGCGSGGGGCRSSGRQYSAAGARLRPTCWWYSSA